MIESIKRIFRKLTPLELASRELVDAERGKLESDSGREYADAMSAYQTARIKRLRALIAAQTKDVP